MAIPKKVQTRIKASLRKYRAVLQDARKADRSEQDTVTIITDMLADIFGYDKYSEITGEYCIRGTYCDLAVRIGGKVRFLMEVKAIAKDLKENHLRQATDYAAKEGIEWVVLSNGAEWQAYRMIFEQPVRYDHVFTIDFLAGGDDLNEMIYMLSREGITKDAIGEYHEQRRVLNAYHLAAIILSDGVLAVLRRELRRVAPGMKITTDDVKDELVSEVIKRSILDSDEIKDAAKRIKRSKTRRMRSRSESSGDTAAPSAPPVADQE
ncbi:MAG: restriction endonuclease subunit R [Phycisphaerae bacterium]|nr:restriction endonuclease subunit R [Phycisphaerae bacterium]